MASDSVETKLKALKVPELRSILSKAGLTTSGVKNDLIKRITESKVALKAIGVEDTEMTAPPAKQQDSPVNVSLPTNQPALPVDLVNAPRLDAMNITEPASSTAPAAPAKDFAVSPSSDVVKTNPDDDEARRKSRAARFNVAPTSEPTPAIQPPPAKASAGSTSTTIGPLPDDPEKLKARAARFGLPPPTAPSTKPVQKRSPAPAVADATIDLEEEERRKKRAARFGIASGPTQKKSKTDS